VIAGLRTLTGAIDAETMRRLNAAVDQDGDSASTVAARFLAAR
jgi:glycine betaine/choline ABC-type transport system substrate-binding protein